MDWWGGQENIFVWICIKSSLASFHLGQVGGVSKKFLIQICIKPKLVLPNFYGRSREFFGSKFVSSWIWCYVIFWGGFQPKNFQSKFVSIQIWCYLNGGGGFTKKKFSVQICSKPYLVLSHFGGRGEVGRCWVSRSIFGLNLYQAKSGIISFWLGRWWGIPNQEQFFGLNLYQVYLVSSHWGV